MNNIYISDNIYFDTNNNNLYYIENNNKKITKNNWHNYLYNLDWNKLNLQWKKRLKLNENMNTKPISKNSLYGLLECGSDGDCLFNCIAEAFNNPINKLCDIYTIKDLRQLVSLQINENNFNDILELYKLQFDNNEFNGNWNPYNINSIDEFKNEINTLGNNFWGDYTCIVFLQKALNINIIILNDDNIKIHPLGQELDRYKKTVILYYYDNIHFQLIGYFNNYMQTLFNYNELPDSIINIYNIDCKKNI